MSLSFSLRLLANEPSKSWLLCRREPVVPCSVFQNSAKVRHSMIYGNKLRILDLLVRPVGVINGILLGYSVGNYHAVFSKQFFPIDVPHCRRFALNLNSGEFMEVHWYPEVSQCLIYWMHLSSSSERSRYFVLYELPPPGRLPTKLLKCVELFIQREYSLYNEDSNTQDGEIVGEYDKDQLAKDKPFAFQGMKDSLKRIVGIFRGTGRRTCYDPVHRNVTEDITFPYAQITYFIQEANENIDPEGQGAVEPPLFSLTIPVVSTHVVTGIVDELLRQEDLHLQAAEGDSTLATLRERVSRERRWRQRLCRKFKRNRTPLSPTDNSLVIPVASHKAAFHLGLSMSGSFFSENDPYWTPLICDGELGDRIHSLETLSSGLWMFTRSGETIFIPSSKQIKRITGESDTDYPHHKRKVSRIGNGEATENITANTAVAVSSSLSGASEDSTNQHHGASSTSEEQESRRALLAKINLLEYQNSLLVQRVQQLERERESKSKLNFSPVIKSPHTEPKDSTKVVTSLDYHEELNRILQSMDTEVHNQWELIGSNMDEHDFFF
ncbi:hypothetical protein GpartN1_g2696.t1 [Galdieria partita]|uniref:Uncharacterized protein n=1 Tax=Galdieria partita TaxID=83374 RepID=A0A9C7PV60_9RHOD|nr:hypothetical protein GpartN1_g2696.t1 [Galdieria partita]